MGCKAVPTCRFEFTLHSLVLVPSCASVDHPTSLHVQAVVAFPSFFFRQIPVIAIIVIPSISTFPRAESTVIVAKTKVLPESGCRMKLSGYFES
jgi:hypothetical protein